MATKKLSRDQKRKLKKRKEKQKSQKPAAKWNNLSVKIIKPGDPEFEQIHAESGFEAQELRLLQIFGTEEIPQVDAATLQTYFAYLKDRLEVPCLLKGIESIGHFGWEERFAFGYGSKAEYERMRQERGSYRDQYELKDFAATLEDDWDIVVNVTRPTDGKRFTIPLSELEAVDRTSANYELLNDYTVWMVNWR